MAGSRIHIALSRSDGLKSTHYLCLDVANSFAAVDAVYAICFGWGYFLSTVAVLVFAISLTGVVVGAFLVYSFPSFGDYDRLLEKKYPDKITNLKSKMQHKNAFWFVAGWSFFPLVPTDAVCYVAGVAKMSLRKMLTALLLGELPFVIMYVFLGAEIGEWLRI